MIMMMVRITAIGLNKVFLRTILVDLNLNRQYQNLREIIIFYYNDIINNFFKDVHLLGIII